MIYLNLWISVISTEDVPFVAECFARCITLSRQEAGCIKYEVYHSQRDRQRFLIVEHWASQDDWDRHRTGRAFLEIYQPEIIPRVTREPHVCDQIEPSPARVAPRMKPPDDEGAPPGGSAEEFGRNSPSTRGYTPAFTSIF